MSEESKINIPSHNQSGGITAHTVNIGPQRRQMTEELAEQLKQLIPLDAKVAVRSVVDGEAESFRDQIRHWLNRNGYTNAKRYGTFQGIPRQTGLTITPNGDGFDIMVGYLE